MVRAHSGTHRGKAGTQLKRLLGSEQIMRCAWVVVLEMACQPGAHLTVETVEALLDRFADRYPSALHAPDRCALQLLIDADGPDEALAAGVALWAPAAA